MDETSVPYVRRGFLVTTWLTAALVGTLIGLLIGFLVQSLWAGLAVGVVVAVIAGVASVVAVRRSGRATVQAAPPWTGDAGVQHQSGGAF